MKNFEGITVLSKRYAERYQVSYNIARENILRTLVVLEESLLDESNTGIQLKDFLTLEKVVRKSKLARNPRTREEVLIPERKAVKTSLGKRFDNLFNI